MLSRRFCENSETGVSGKALNPSALEVLNGIVSIRVPIIPVELSELFLGNRVGERKPPKESFEVDETE
jgi:hypothetical protein